MGWFSDLFSDSPEEIAEEKRKKDAKLKAFLDKPDAEKFAILFARVEELEEDLSHVNRRSWIGLAT